MSQTSSSAAAAGGRGSSGREERELLESQPYRSVFVACESLEPDEVESLYDDFRGAVSSRLVEEEA